MTKVETEAPKRAAKPGRDWLATTFSAVALVLSLLSFYFSTFYVSNRLTARVASNNFSIDANGEADGFVLGIALINSGNRPSIVSSIDFAVGDEEDAPDLEWRSTSNDLPVLVPANDLRLIKVRLPVRDVFDEKRKRGKQARTAVPAQFVFLDFITVASNGDRNRFLSPAIFGAMPSESGMRTGTVFVSVEEEIFDLLNEQAASRARVKALLQGMDKNAPAVAR